MFLSESILERIQIAQQIHVKQKQNFAKSTIFIEKLNKATSSIFKFSALLYRIRRSRPIS